MILYHQSNNQIVFAICKNTTQKLNEWFACSEIFRQFHSHIIPISSDVILNSGSLCFDFNFVNKDSVFLRVHPAKSLAFAAFEQASDLASLENQNQSWNTTINGETIFSISDDIYQHLAAWGMWNASEALTSRYSYDFQLFYHGLTDLRREYFRVFDRQTKNLFEITRDEDEYRGDKCTNSKIEKNINVLNEFLERDYRIMSVNESIRKFYPEYGRSKRTFYSKFGGLACEYFIWGREIPPI